MVKLVTYAFVFFVSAHHVYCSTCRHENEHYDPRKKDRLQKAVIQQHNGKIAAQLRGISVHFGVSIHVNGKGVWTMGLLKDQVPSSSTPMSALLPSRVAALVPNSLASDTSLSGASLSSSTIQTVSSQNSTGSTLEKLRDCSISPIEGDFVAIAAMTSLPSTSTQSSLSRKRSLSPKSNRVSQQSEVMEVISFVLVSL